MSILVSGGALKRFTGAVKPFFNLDGLNLTIRYGEVVSLAEWQTSHPSFRFALENGWVVSVDRKTIVFNAETPKKPSNAMRSKRKKSAEIVQELPESGLDPVILQTILDKQEGFVRQAQKTFERLTAQKKEPEQPTVTPEMFASMLENQRKMMEMLEKEKQQPVPQAPALDQTAVLNALKLLTNEVKRLQESKPSEAPVNTDQILEGVKQVMSQFSPSSGSYNGTKKDPSGFQIRDDFEEKFIPKVEDLEVKNSNIVAQEKDSGSVEEALAALRKLKEKK